MMAATPPATYAPAPEAVSLDAAFVRARTSARAAARPEAVLADPSASIPAKLDALNALQDRIPGLPRAPQAAALNALADAAGPAQPPQVRALALTLLGESVPPVLDADARARAVLVLLDALKEPDYRLFALRGLGPASHGLTPAMEPVYESALLDLLDGPAAGEERETALVALNGFVSGGLDFAQRAPQLLTVLEARLQAPIAADPAAFVRDPRWTPDSRELAAAILWLASRRQEEAGDSAPTARFKALMIRLIAVDPDAAARAWYASYRDAPPPKPGFTASTTSRPSDGRDEP
ncbi:MAG: hypothetical protein HKL90_06240 [Elusimicrobia bacterium]|nr:hypothetical protein [Elusimicrobiota bacterium]